MIFSKISTSELVKLIKAFEVTVFTVPNNNFIHIYPLKNKELQLKSKYTIQDKDIGLYSQYSIDMQQDKKFKKQVKDHIKQSGYKGSLYSHKSASFKLHISINEIATIDHTIILGLIELLITEHCAEDNDLSCNFKIIQPELHDNHRFAMNDQLTIYFDKYTAAADLVRLSEKILQYLLEKQVKINTRMLGEKDIFSYNSFVSARFDTNRLLHQYNVYRFFDYELDKFFKEKHTNVLKLIPLCAFDSVFNKVFYSEKIQIPHKTNTQIALSDKDSRYVQREFDLLVKNPLEYLEVQELEFSSQNIDSSPKTASQSPVFFKSSQTQDEQLDDKGSDHGNNI
ncbi:MAG: hypothetical protein WC627_11645 [Legionella sp.]